MTSLKGPHDPIYSIPPQFFPSRPDARELPARARDAADPDVLHEQPDRGGGGGAAQRAGRRAGRLPAGEDAVPGPRARSSTLLLATLIVPAQLTYIPSFVLAVNVFQYYDTLAALIFPNLVSAFNIFLLRQAFRGVPNDLIDAARVDGAGEWRIWWSILMPIVRPSLAAVAIFTFVTSWNDFLWPSLMLHTKDGLTLPVGLAALQGFFPSDFRCDRRRGHDHGRARSCCSSSSSSATSCAAWRARSRGDHGGDRPRGPRPGDARVRGRGAPAWVAARLAEAPAAGMTLFRHHNVRSPGQVRELTDAFQHAGAACPRAAPAPAPRGRGPGGRPAPRPRRRPDGLRRQHGARRGR